MNCDGVRDSNDVAPFVQALIAPAAYAVAFPQCDINRADVNVDLAIDGLDVQAFVDLLLAP